jgi:hypothetical protein
VVGPDSPEEDSSAEFEGLAERLRAEPVSIEQADERVNTLLEKHLGNRKGPFQYVIDASLPPETVIQVHGTNVTLSVDAADSILRHHERVKKRPPFTKPRKTGKPYRGS